MIATPGEFSGITLAEFVRRVLERENARPSIADPTISCGKACGACCRQLVTLSPGEISYLRELIETLPELRRSEVKMRFEIAVAAVRDAGLHSELLRLKNPSLTEAEHYEIARKYFALQIACPFLEGESCSIYDQRPALCREYAVTSPNARCRNPFETQVDVVAVSRSLSAALASLWAHLNRSELAPIPLVFAQSDNEIESSTVQLRFDEPMLWNLLENYLELHASDSVAHR